MRKVGERQEPTLAYLASGVLLAEGARFSQTMAKLAPCTFIPKGVYRFASHEDANRHQQDCLVRGMGLLAAQRGMARP
jgi:hypothetical protein